MSQLEDVHLMMSCHMATTVERVEAGDSVKYWELLRKVHLIEPNQMRGDLVEMTRGEGSECCGRMTVVLDRDHALDGTVAYSRHC